MADIDRSKPQPRRGEPNPLFALLGWNLAGGAVAAVILVAAVLITDTGHLGTLIRTSDEPLIPLLLLLFGFLITLGSVAMGSAIMSLPRLGPDDDDDDDEPGHREPVRVLARSSRGRR